VPALGGLAHRFSEEDVHALIAESVDIPNRVFFPKLDDKNQLRAYLIHLVELWAEGKYPEDWMGLHKFNGTNIAPYMSELIPNAIKLLSNERLVGECKEPTLPVGGRVGRDIAPVFVSRFSPQVSLRYFEVRARAIQHSSPYD